MDQKERNIDVNVRGMGDEVLKGIHQSKSYVGAAWLTLLLYYVGFYIVGLIVNIIYLSQAKETERIIHKSPSGKGCLVFLLWTQLIIPIIIFLSLVLGLFSLPFLDFL